MSTVVALVQVVKDGSTWAATGVHVGHDTLAATHEVIGALVVVGAVLLVATAGPRRRSRAVAVVFALAAIAVVVAGCASPASAADGVAVSPGTVRLDPALLAALVVGLAGVLCLAVMRLVFRMVAVFLRVIEVVASVRQAALLLTVAATVVAVVAIAS